MHSGGGSWKDNPSRLMKVPFNISHHVRMEVSSFQRELDPDKLLNWLMKLEQYMGTHIVPNYGNIKTMEMKLEDHALIWWTMEIHDEESMF